MVILGESRPVNEKAAARLFKCKEGCCQPLGRDSFQELAESGLLRRPFRTQVVPDEEGLSPERAFRCLDEVEDVDVVGIDFVREPGISLRDAPLLSINTS